MAFGVAVIFQESQLAFSLLKYAGSAYLIYLAWQAFRAEPANDAENSNPIDSTRNSARLYLRGILMNITNPKVSIFFLAFLPQFVNQQAGYVSLQMFTLGSIFILAAVLAFSMMAIMAASIGARFGQSPRVQKNMNRLAGVVFLGLAAKLATTER